jgi:ATP/maltotriose-dependent transcriptional regulator MalT
MKAAEAKVAEILRQKGLRDIADERLHSAAYEWFDKHGW